MITFGCGVLVSQCRSRRAMAEPGHDLYCRRSSASCHSPGEVAEDVEVEVVAPGILAGRAPVQAEVMAEKRTALVGSEAESVWLGTDELGEVCPVSRNLDTCSRK
jgi:hypothetical protein